MTKDEFIVKWVCFNWEFLTYEKIKKYKKEFESDLDDLMAWYKHELWDQWNDKPNQQ